MGFRDYWLGLTLAERPEFAEKCETTVGYLDHVSTGYRKASAPLVHRIAANSQYQVTPHDLRPDVFLHADDGLPLERRAAQAAE